MRLLITTDTIGGVWTFTRELTRGLLEQGHSVALVSLGREPDRDQQAWAERTRAGSAGRFEYHQTNSPLEWMQSNGDAFTHSAPLLERLAETFRPDVIHANQFCFGALATRVPVLITAHSDVFSWAEACNPPALAATPWLAAYESLVQHGLAAAAGVVAPTRWMLGALAAHFKLPVRHFIAPNGRTLEAAGVASETRDRSASEVPSAPSQEREAGLAVRKLQAVTAGRLWDEGKNLALLLELVSPVPLVVAGGAPPDQATNGLTFAGQLCEQELLALFRESAIYVCPSKYEPFGLAPLEAALCGCAVLANDLPSLREVWGDAALYFTDAASLERLLSDMHGNPERLEAAQRRSRSRAGAYSCERMTEAYLRCYREVLQPQREAEHAA